MREVYVNIGSVEKAKGLNGVLRKLEGDFDLVQGRATIDAKSFLGILSMDLSKSVKLIIHDSDSVDMTLLSLCHIFFQKCHVDRITVMNDQLDRFG